MRRWLLALAVVTGLVLCGGPPAHAASATTYVGRVRGSDAFVAIVKDGRDVAGYVCDNGTISRWVQPTRLRHDRASLTAGVTGQHLGSVQLSRRSARGTVLLGAQQIAFSARQAAGRKAGLFAGVTKQANRVLVAGWIVRPNGTQRGAVSSLDTQTLRSLPPARAPLLEPTLRPVQIQGDPQQAPANAQPVRLTEIDTIEILIGLLRPAS
jgi:hypothetical protein